MCFTTKLAHSCSFLILCTKQKVRLLLVLIKQKCIYGPVESFFEMSTPNTTNYVNGCIQRIRDDITTPLLSI